MKKRMRSKILSWLLILGLVLTSVPLAQVPVYAQDKVFGPENVLKSEFKCKDYESGIGYVKTTFEIKSAEELALLAILVNNNIKYECRRMLEGKDSPIDAEVPYSEASYVLTGDIDLKDLQIPNININLKEQ